MMQQLAAKHAREEAEEALRRAQEGDKALSSMVSELGPRKGCGSAYRRAEYGVSNKLNTLQ